MRVEEMAKAGSVLDAAIEAGANASSGIEFTLADPGEFHDRSLELAVADARRRANLLATALGVTIGGVERVIAAGAAVAPMMGRAHRVFRGLVHAPGVPSTLEAGQLRIIVDIQVTYSFQ